jgi:hypothetical protein
MTVGKAALAAASGVLAFLLVVTGLIVWAEIRTPSSADQFVVPAEQPKPPERQLSEAEKSAMLERAVRQAREDQRRAQGDSYVDPVPVWPCDSPRQPHPGCPAG